MRVVLLAFLALGALILQTTFFSFFSVGGVKPDLLLILTVFFALYNGKRNGALYGAYCGLLADLALGRFIGMNTAIFAGMGYLFGFLEGKIYRDNLFVPVVTTLSATALYGLLFILFANIAGFQVSWLQWLGNIFLVGLYNSAVAPFVYGPYLRIHRHSILPDV